MLLAETTTEQKVLQIITPSLDQLGYELVRVKMMDADKRKTLQVMLDRADGVTITVEDCQKASRQISALLDVEDPITDRYDLEVSSPGLDRPLTRLKDFEAFKGLEAKVEAREKINGRRRFKGRLAGVEGEEIVLDNLVEASADTAEKTVKIAFDNIQNAKLILNDELLKTAQ